MSALDNQRKIATAFFVICFIFFLTSCTNSSDFDSLLSIHMIDVGQSESILIIAPNGNTILIDAGDEVSGRKVVRYLKKRKIDDIDVMIVTHPHSDHIGGVEAVANKYDIDKFFMPDITHNTDTFEGLLQILEEHNIDVSFGEKNMRMQIDDSLYLFLLSPIKDHSNNLNNWSIVAKIQYNKKSFLFTGDAEYELEMNLIEMYDANFLRSHVLKIGHHGSNTSTSEKFLDVVQPSVALISVGEENPYGFPHREVIRRLINRNIMIYRTDEQSNIVILSDGNEIWSYDTPWFH
ncbi:MAG: MBL fold metallo-hydrolase [Clostridiales bacterium]|nr:MBL fold metallo-hydrolase [Clostridiales bacterium]